MAKKKRKVSKLWYAAFLVVLIIISIFGVHFLSVYQSKNVNMIQYAGSITEDWDRWDIVKSSTAKFDGYEIITQKQSSGCIYSDWECSPNTCNGVQVGEDEHGCPLYEGSKTVCSGTAPNNACGNCCSRSSSTPLSSENKIGGCLTCGCLFNSGYCTKTQETVQCGKATRSESCGIGCYAKFTIKKDGQLIYDTVDYIKTQEVRIVPIGLRQTATLKTLCKYESTGDNYFPCIYEEGSNEGEYAPISYCEAKYGKMVSCDDVLVDEYVQDNMLASAQGDDVNINSKLLRVQFNYASQYSKGTCRRIENTFEYIVPKDAFDFTVTVPEGDVLQGDDINVEIKIKNTWQPVKGNLVVYFEIPTSLFNPSTETASKIIDIPQDESVHSYTIPTGMAAEVLKVKPTLHVLLEGSRFEGVNGKCFGQTDSKVRDLNKCDYIEIGTVTEDAHEIKIQPISDILEKELEEKISLISTYEGEKDELEAQVKEILSQMDEMSLTSEQEDEYISELQANLNETDSEIDVQEIESHTVWNIYFFVIPCIFVVLIIVAIIMLKRRKRRKNMRK